MAGEALKLRRIKIDRSATEQRRQRRCICVVRLADDCDHGLLVANKSFRAERDVVEVTRREFH